MQRVLKSIHNPTLGKPDAFIVGEGPSQPRREPKRTAETCVLKFVPSYKMYQNVSIERTWT